MADYVKALVNSYLPEKSEGQGMVEYALILALVSIVAIVVLTTLGPQVAAILTAVQTALTPAG